MPDLLEELRRLAGQASPATPFVRVTGEFLDRVADELAALRKRDEEITKQLLFGKEGATR